MKRSFPLLILIYTLIACNESPTPKVSGKTGPEKIVEQYFDHFNKHDFVKMAAMYADTADFKDPTPGPGIVKQSR